MDNIFFDLGKQILKVIKITYFDSTGLVITNNDFDLREFLKGYHTNHGLWFMTEERNDYRCSK